MVLKTKKDREKFVENIKAEGMELYSYPPEVPVKATCTAHLLDLNAKRFHYEILPMTYKTSLKFANLYLDNLLILVYLETEDVEFYSGTYFTWNYTSCMPEIGNPWFPGMPSPVIPGDFKLRKIKGLSTKRLNKVTHELVFECVNGKYLPRVGGLIYNFKKVLS